MNLKEIRKLAYPDVSPSLLAADKSNIPAEVASIEGSCHFVHIDIMDAVFVKNRSFYKEFPGTFYTSLIKDTHLMVIDPLHWIDEAVRGGSGIVTFHEEAYHDFKKNMTVISRIHKLGACAGISIKPGTPVDRLIPYISKVDLILVMTVEPGLGGQEYIEESDERIAAVAQLLKDLPLDKRPIIEVDGGINGITAKRAVSNGAELLVAGSYLFGHPDIRERIKGLKDG